METVLDFLKNSSENGFGFLVISVLLYLFVFFLIQYFQHKKLFYLLYSLYALVNGIGLLRHIKGVFFSDLLETKAGFLFNKAVHYPCQLLGTILFSYFIISIMNLRKEYPRIIKTLDYYYKITSTVYILLWGIYMFNPKSYLIDYFHGFLYIPLGYIVFLLILYMVYKQKTPVKKYIFSGMSILGITYLILFITTIKTTTVDDQQLYIFYIGILIESLLFALAIGLEQKMVFEQNTEIQKKYILQLEENQIIKNGINRALSEELAQTKSNFIDISVEAQKERGEKLAFKFENKVSQLRLDALTSQMNPHFIFNALNSIKSYFIENNQEKAIFYLSKFSKLIRSILENSRKEQISLTEELKTIAVYVEIECDRFKNDIDFSIEVGDKINTDKAMVPALFLQPFVENAIWHGLLNKKGKKVLKIKVSESKKVGTLEITIADNGLGRKATKEKNVINPFKKESLGLKLTKDRLDHFSFRYGKPYSFTITDKYKNNTGETSGTLVCVEIPQSI